MTASMTDRAEDTGTSEGDAAAVSEGAVAGPSAKKGPTYETLGVFAFVLSLIAVMVAVFALALAARAIDDHRAVPAGGGGGPAAPSVPVALNEFTISPDPVEATGGSMLAVVNDGAVPHDLAIEGEDRATPELQSGDQATLDLSGLAPGTYTVFCQVAGHRSAGMEATLVVS